eukprot:1157767-Pelagomonas_calceolata.AAC.13
MRSRMCAGMRRDAHTGSGEQGGSSSVSSTIRYLGVATTGALHPASARINERQGWLISQQYCVSKADQEVAVMHIGHTFCPAQPCDQTILVHRFEAHKFCVLHAQWHSVFMVTMVRLRRDLQPSRLAYRLVAGPSQPETNP